MEDISPFAFFVDILYQVRINGEVYHVSMNCEHEFSASFMTLDREVRVSVLWDENTCWFRCAIAVKMLGEARTLIAL